MNRKLLLIGGGGHCKSVLDTILRFKMYDEIGIIDLPENIGNLVLGVPIIADDSQLPGLKNCGYTDAFITLGSIGNPEKRMNALRLIDEMGYTIPNIIDQTTNIGEQVNLGKGIFIGKNTVVNAGSEIGDGAIINTGSIVEHDCKIGAFVHVAPGSVICGNVQIGEGTHIGAGSMVKQGIQIGKYTVIGLGSIVLQNIGSQIKAFGSPCKEQPL